MQNNIDKIDKRKGLSLFIPKYPKKETGRKINLLYSHQQSIEVNLQKSKNLFDIISIGKEISIKENKFQQERKQTPKPSIIDKEIRFERSKFNNTKRSKKIRKAVMNNERKDTCHLIRHETETRLRPFFPYKNKTYNTEFLRRIQFIKSYWNSSNLIIPDPFKKIKKLTLEPYEKCSFVSEKDYGLRKL